MKVLAVALLLISAGCNTVRYGVYETQCRLHAYPLAALKLNSNKSFQYEFAYTHIKVKGVWKLRADTLVLESAGFIQDSAIHRPQVKFDTSSAAVEIFIYKRGKLYPLIKRKGCYLSRVRNE